MDSRQRLIYEWAIRTFGAVAAEPVERAARLTEESLEVAQAAGMSKERALKIIERVFSRPPGNVAKEIGGCAVTLYAIAECFGVSMDQEASAEFNRVRSIPQDEWDRRHSAKVAEGTAVAGSQQAEGA